MCDAKLESCGLIGHHRISISLFRIQLGHRSFRQKTKFQFYSSFIYNACRLIPLDKNPGVRPIGVGEIVRRISARVILKCIGHDLKALGGNSQLCLGQKSGIEHAIHSLREKFEHDDSEAMLLIDAKNTFNSLNRSLALQNIELICPSIVTALRNSYDSPSNLYVNGKLLLSQEGTTH